MPNISTMFCLLCHFWINARVMNIRAINTATLLLTLALLDAGLPASEHEDHL